MTAAYATERRLPHNHRGSLDYDDSLVPGKIVASIMHLGKVTDKEDACASLRRDSERRPRDSGSLSSSPQYRLLTASASATIRRCLAAIT